MIPQGLVVADTGAIARVNSSPAVRNELTRLGRLGLLATCLTIDREVLYSARSPIDYVNIAKARRGAFTDFPCRPKSANERAVFRQNLLDTANIEPPESSTFSLRLRRNTTVPPSFTTTAISTTSSTSSVVALQGSLMHAIRKLAVPVVFGASLLVAAFHRHRSVLCRSRLRWDPPIPPTVTGPLSARVIGHGEPVVLLHGLGASGRYWGAAYDRLGVDHRLVIPDLLGFGALPRPDHGYGPDEPAAAVCGCLDAAGVHEPAVLVAHSAGTVVALRIASTRPDRVRAVICVGPPLYPNPQEAARHVAELGAMARLFANDGRVAERVCHWVCQHRDLASRLAVFSRPDLPAQIAADGVQHSWNSYSESLTGLVLAGDLSEWFDDIAHPVVFIAGDRDAVCDREWLRVLAERHDNVRLETWPGEHHLPLAEPDAIMRLVRQHSVR